MKTRIFGVVAVAMLALTGCGNVCNDLENAGEAYEDKYQPCATAGEDPGAFNTNQCSDNIDDCTDSEKEALADFADCVRELPECTPATRDNFGIAFAGCGFSLAGKVGETCAAAISGS